MNIATDKSKVTNPQGVEFENVSLEGTTGASDPDEDPHHKDEHEATVPAGGTEEMQTLSTRSKQEAIASVA
jgi:hypothetical protein